jgi:peptidoglycan/xylan/chitin deacetylase (PgdA/CDA1 family)
METRIPILAYHSIDQSRSVISTAPEEFRRQMEYLKTGSYQTTSLKEVVACIREQRPFPAKTVAITFDDGYKNIYSEAFPVLREFGFQATVFLVTGYFGMNNQWNAQPAGIPKLDLLNEDEIMEMSAHGIDFGSHTESHPDLTKLSATEVIEEIRKSKTKLQELLGKPPLFFAYPYGKQNEECNSSVSREFLGACSTLLDFVTLRTDVYSLPRIDMYYLSGNQLIQWLDTSFFSCYIKCRNVLRVMKRKMGFSAYS